MTDADCANDLAITSNNKKHAESMFHIIEKVINDIGCNTLIQIKPNLCQ